MEYSNLFVCMMGIGTVFFGLICIIALIFIMSYLCNNLHKKRVSMQPENSDCVINPKVIAAIIVAIENEQGRKLTNSNLRINKCK